MGWTKTGKGTWRNSKGESWTKTGKDTWRHSSGKSYTKSGNTWWGSDPNDKDDAPIHLFDEDDDW